MTIGAIRLNKTERRRVTGPAGSELLARWLNLPRSRSDQRAGESPEAKNENRPPGVTRPPLPHARRARDADCYPHLLSPARWQNRVGDEVIQVARASRAVSVVPRSRARLIEWASIGQGCARLGADAGGSNTPAGVQGRRQKASRPALVQKQKLRMVNR